MKHKKVSEKKVIQHSPNPEGIKSKVYKMYPELKKRAAARKKK